MLLPMTKRLLLLIDLITKGGYDTMAMLYASCIIRGTKTFSDVPATLKNDIRQILLDEGLENLTRD